MGRPARELREDGAAGQFSCREFLPGLAVAFWGKPWYTVSVKFFLRRRKFYPADFHKTDEYGFFRGKRDTRPL